MKKVHLEVFIVTILFVGLGILSQEQKYEKLTEQDVAEIISLVLTKVNISVLDEILRYITKEGRVTRETLRDKFNLTDKPELRPLLAALQNEGLIKQSRGFYPTPKLIEAHQITNGFTSESVLATLATLATPKNDPPPPREKLGDFNNV